MDFFRKIPFRTRQPAEGSTLPAGLWTKCRGCEALLPKNELKENLQVCPQCGHHHRIPARARIKIHCDPGSFIEEDARLSASDPLGFSDTKPYTERIFAAKHAANEREAVVTGTGAVEGVPVAIAVMEFAFLGGSMGSVVGEKIARLVERATEARRPVLLVTASGGARMQEGILSLMQMAKTAAAIARHREAGLLSVSLLTDPTTGGTTASFATLPDILLAEPGALIAFAGPRVIEQTIRQKLPKGFQRSEFLLEHGLVDAILPRKEIRPALARILRWSGVPSRS